MHELNSSSSYSNFENSQYLSRKVCITGGKGGVGKTSIALKMGLELANMGFKVLLLDCDANLSNTSIKMGFGIDNRFEKLLSSELSFEDCVMRQGNFHLLPSCNGSLDLFENKMSFEQVVMDIIESHACDYDYILLDSPAGANKSSLALNSICDERIMIVTPDKSSITDSYSLMKILKQKFDVNENHLLINMYQNDRQLQKVSSTLIDTVSSFLKVKLNFLGGVIRLDVKNEDFDTFFLSNDKNETNKNFAKLLYRFTENVVGPQGSLINFRSSKMAPEQNVR
jgi:flagellar biosynthesis protein FlhG